MTRPIRLSLAALVLAVAVGGLVLPSRAHADVPGLQVAPLQYEDTLKPGHIENGFIDVANPGDAAVNIISEVKGFKQTGANGDLQFFSDPDLAAAIKVSLESFTLGPREAVRVIFSVDPAKLPGGGVYAAVFFRTQPPSQTSTSSYVAESANVGTLLLLNNGASTAHYGQVTALRLPFWQFGGGLTGSLTYHNTDTTATPLGFRPSLEVRVLPWGKAPKLNTGLVLPKATRVFPVARPGAYFGLLPVFVTDTDTGNTVATWVFACTGLYGFVVIVLVVLLVLLLAVHLARHRRRPRRAKPSKKPIDGLSSKRHHAPTQPRSTPMAETITATKSVDINATPEKIWEALTTPEIIKQYMFGAEAASDWKVGSPIVYKGEWEGKPYEDKGTILEIEPNKLLKSTYFSPMSGREDKPENYNTVTYELSDAGDGVTKLTVSQTNNPTKVGADQAEQNWTMVLDAIKGLLEK